MLSGMVDGSWVIAGFGATMRLGAEDPIPLIQIKQTAPWEGTMQGRVLSVRCPTGEEN